MLIFPAIDLKDGRVVRLVEGDYDRMTVYGNDPLAAAKAYRAAGAEYKPCNVPTKLLMESKKYDFAGSMYGDKSNTVIFDNSLLHRLVPTFQQKKRFDQSARDSVSYILSHPELQVEDPEFDAFCDAVAQIMDSAAERIRAL